MPNLAALRGAVFTLSGKKPRRGYPPPPVGVRIKSEICIHDIKSEIIILNNYLNVSSTSQTLASAIKYGPNWQQLCSFGSCGGNDVGTTFDIFVSLSASTVNRAIKERQS